MLLMGNYVELHSPERGPDDLHDDDGPLYPRASSSASVANRQVISVSSLTASLGYGDVEND